MWIYDNFQRYITPIIEPQLISIKSKLVIIREILLTFCSLRIFPFVLDKQFCFSLSRHKFSSKELPMKRAFVILSDCEFYLSKLTYREWCSISNNKVIRFTSCILTKKKNSLLRNGTSSFTEVYCRYFYYYYYYYSNMRSKLCKSLNLSLNVFGLKGTL